MPPGGGRGIPVEELGKSSIQLDLRKADARKHSPI